MVNALAKDAQVGVSTGNNTNSIQSSGIEPQDKTNGLIHNISPLSHPQQSLQEDENVTKLANLTAKDRRFLGKEQPEWIYKALSKTALKPVEKEERAGVIDQAAALNGMVNSMIPFHVFVYFLGQNTKEERAEICDNLKNNRKHDGKIPGDLCYTLFSLPPKDRLSFSALSGQSFNLLQMNEKRVHVLYHLLPDELRTQEKLQQALENSCWYDCEEYRQAIVKSLKNKLFKNNREHYSPLIPDELLLGAESSRPSSFLDDMFEFTVENSKHLNTK